jgi:predicted nuclease of predicted toxin-antitoxin system
MATRFQVPSASRLLLMAKLLIDECLHTSLVALAHGAGYPADHVTYLGLGGSKDWQLMPFIREGEYTLVTNNGSDFLALYGREAVHAGLVVIVPNVPPAQQRELFRAVLVRIAGRDLTNTVIEVDFRGGTIECREYRFPLK